MYETHYCFRYGRKKAMMVAFVMKIFGGYIAALSPTYLSMVIGRFILGMGTNLGYAVVVVLCKLGHYMPDLIQVLFFICMTI